MAGSIQNVENKTEVTKLYKKRWLILLLYIFYCTSSLIQHYHYTILADVVAQYYVVSYTTINWSVLIMSIIYIVLSYPGNYIMDRIGLRNTVLVGTIGTLVGTAVKFASVHPDRFWVAILAQGIMSIFYICMLPVLPKVTAVWFGTKEIATANALGLLGIQFGIALSFLTPPLIVLKGENDDIARRLNYLNIGFIGFSIVMTILVYFFFSNAPPIPPSVAQKKLNEEKQNKIPSGFVYICKQLFGNKSYLIFIFIYAINTKSISPFKAMLNEIVLHYYPDARHHVGVIGLLVYFFGITGSISIGLILDKYKNFKMTVYISYAVHFVSVALFIGVQNQGLPFLYVTAIIMGIADACLFTSVIEIIMELTYPLPENVTLGLALILANIATVVIVSLYSIIFESVGIFWANITILILLFVTNLNFYFIKFDLKRHSAENSTEKEDIQLEDRQA